MRIYSDLTPKEYSSKFLAKELISKLKKNEKVLILRAKEGSEIITEQLKKNNFLFEDFKLYELKENKEEIYSKIDENTAILENAYKKIGLTTNRIGSLMSAFLPTNKYRAMTMFCFATLINLQITLITC